MERQVQIVKIEESQDQILEKATKKASELEHFEINH